MNALFKKPNLSMFISVVALFLVLTAIESAIAPPQIREETSGQQFDVSRAFGRLQRVLADQRPHPVDTDANEQVRERIVKEIEALGYVPLVRDDIACDSSAPGSLVCARVQNVVFVAGPDPFLSKSDTDAILIASHYDSVPVSPGASDDGAGVAVSLEIAHLLRNLKLARPVIFLFTDGEEAGLLGASSFISKDPFADQISNVINIEARGSSGPAVMFETAHPNSTVIKHYSEGAERPVSNSLMTDIYRLMPNHTDMTKFLERGYSGLNFAIADRVEHYHTPLDRLENVDLRSLQHMGDLVLGAASSMLEGDHDLREARREVIFTDFLSRSFVVLPQWVGMSLMLFGALMAGVGYLRVGGGHHWRAILAPPVTFIISVLIAVILQVIIRQIRAELGGGAASSAAMQVLAYTSGAVAAVFVLSVVVARSGADRLNYSVWLWIAAVGGAGGYFVPGAIILFALPLGLFGLFALISSVVGKENRWGSLISCGLFVLLLAPTIYLIEIAFGRSATPLLAFLSSILFLPALTAVLHDAHRPSFVVIKALGALLVGATIAALMLPGHSPEHPGLMNIIYEADVEAQRANWIIHSQDEGTYLSSSARPAIFAGEDHVEAPFQVHFLPKLEVLDEGLNNGNRVLSLRLLTDGADVITLEIPHFAHPVSMQINENAYPYAAPDAHGFDGEKFPYLFTCHGRTCDGLELTVELRNSEKTEWVIIGRKYGLPSAGEDITAGRPRSYIPVHDGDMTIMIGKNSL